MLRKSTLALAFVPLAVPYALCLLLLMNPWVQRQALYAHNIHTSWWDDLDDLEAWGFGKNQVTAFEIKTPDGQTLHALHILPRALYAQHETELLAENTHKLNDFKTSLAYRLLTENPESKLVINFHGNAGHLLQNQRPYVYRSFSTLDINTHVIAFSYRGFGRSSGSPVEPGLITDGITVVNYALNDLRIPPANMALVGQSLGTAVVSGVVEYFGTTGPTNVPLPLADDARKKIDFATIVLVSAFSDLKTMLLKYRIGGYIPILAPLAHVPGLPSLMNKIVHETWESKVRLAKYVEEALNDATAGTRRLANIQLLHALDDPDIPYENTLRIYDTALNAGEKIMASRQTEHGSIAKGAWKQSAVWGSVQLNMRLISRGGHNQIATDTPIAVAVMRGLGLVEPLDE